MKEALKKYIYGIIFAIIVAGAGWVAVIDTRTFETAKQRVNIVDAVEAMPTEAERAVELANDAHAIEIRQLRYDNAVKDKAEEKEYQRRRDSIWGDKFDRQTVQIEQMKAKIDNEN